MWSLFRGSNSSSTNTASPKLSDEIQVPHKCVVYSIPEDVLAIIFRIVFLQQCERQADASETTSSCSPALSVVKLSHVSQKFRVVSLSNPHLWTHISGSDRYPEMDLIHACFERSQNLPLAIHLNVYLDSMYGPSCDSVLAAAKPHAHRWRIVRIRFIHIPHGPPEYSIGYVGPVKGLDALNGIVMPALEKLVLDNDMWFLEDETSFFKSWKTPMLRNLVAVHGFPFQLPSIQTITALDITLSLRTTHLRALLSLLSNLPNLSELGIFLDNHQRFHGGFEHENDVPFQSTPLHGVQRLRITTATENKHDDYSERLEKMIYRALSFPNAHALTVTFVGEPIRGGTPDPLFFLFDAADRIFEWFIANGSIQFPNVSRLFINISASNPDIERGEAYLHGGVASFLLPLHIFPSLKDLCVQSNMPVDFGTHYFEKLEQPALQRIKLDVTRLASSSSSPHWQWIRALADTLLAQGAWHQFQELTLTERFLGVRPDGIRKWDVKSVLSRDMLFKNAYMAEEEL